MSDYIFFDITKEWVKSNNNGWVTYTSNSINALPFFTKINKDKEENILDREEEIDLPLTDKGEIKRKLVL